MWFKQTPDEKNPNVRIVEHQDGKTIDHTVCKDLGPAAPGQLCVAEIVVAQRPVDTAPDDNEPLLRILVTHEKRPSSPSGFDAAFVVPLNQSSHDFAYRLARTLLSPLEEGQELNCDPNDIQALVRQGSGSSVGEYGYGQGMGPEAGAEAAKKALEQLSAALNGEKPGGLLVSIIVNSRGALFEAVKGVSGQLRSVNDKIVYCVGGDIEPGHEAGQVGVHMYFFSGADSVVPVATSRHVGEMTEKDIPMFFRKPVFEEGKP